MREKEAHGMSELEDAQKETAKLQSELQQYKRLEEDLIAQRIVENAKKQITQSITFGGLFLSLVGFVGVTEVVKYAKDQAANKFEAVGKEKVEEYLRAEEQRQITDAVQKLQGPLMEYAKQQIQVTISPVGAISATGTTGPLNSGLQLDYSSLMLPARNEGQIGATVGFATAYALEFQIRKNMKRSVRISPRYLYYLARNGTGVRHKDLPDTGAVISDAIQILFTNGAVAEDFWPYDPNSAGGAPPEDSGTERFKIKSSHQLSSIEDVRSALKTYGPLIAGITVYASMLSPEVAETGVVPMPKKDEELRGGHAVCVVGYDDDRQLLKFENMWGADWGDHGYGYMPYAFFKAYSHEVWAISSS
jgi:C1A family cysteine protease